MIAAQRRTPRKKIAHHLMAQHRHVSALLIIKIVQPASLAHRQIADFIKIGRDSDDLSIAGGKITHGADIASLQHRRTIAHQLGLMADVKIILVGKEVLFHSLVLSGHRRNPARKDEDNILSHGLKLTPVAGAEALPQSHQQK